METKCKQVNFESILSDPVKCTCRRMMSEKVVLVWQDQTKMNFTSKPETEGMEPIGKDQTEAISRGFLLQTSLASTPDGLPLGPLKATYTVRKEKSKKRTAEEKESYTWNLHAQFANEVAEYMPDTQVIEICDRGADIGLFIYDCYEMKNIELIVRTKSNIRIPDEPYPLFTLLENTPVAGSIEVIVPRRSERAKLSGKKAILNIRFRRVKIAPPPEKKGQTPIEVYAISATERNTPAGEKSIVWRLLTTVTVKNFDEAVLYVKYYAKRWGIEEFHRILKTGCRVEYMAYKDIDRITRELDVSMVIACRLMLLLKLGREMPDLPPEAHFNDVELTVLRTMSEGKKNLNNLHDAVVMVAKLGGYLARNRDPEPGYEVFWKGYDSLQHMCHYERLRRRKKTA